MVVILQQQIEPLVIMITLPWVFETNADQLVQYQYRWHTTNYWWTIRPTLIQLELVSTLSSGIDASVTTIPITSSTGFPATGTVGVGTEEITYTGVAGNTLTGATRGANSTTAAAHLSSAAIGTVFSTPSNYNALSAGPVGIAVGSTITLGTDSTWTVV